jgi:arylsulfatase A-like enzyme
MAAAWSWAFDTPFKWMKQVASHFGGTRQGMAIAWPSRIKDAGGIRNQFHHMIDIVPTILEVTGIPAPARSTASPRNRFDFKSDEPGFGKGGTGGLGRDQQHLSGCPLWAWGGRFVLLNQGGFKLNHCR